MAYYDTISALRESLDGYSAEEEKLAELYEKAFYDEKINYINALNHINYTYGMDRHTAYSDNARNDRSYNQFLAARGLGFSGEAAQAKLNSNILLSNRLREISMESAKSDKELTENYNNNLNKLKMEQAEKLKAIYDNKNQLTADIAALELEHESEQAKLAAEQAMQNAQLEADKEMFYAELEAKYNQATSGNGKTEGSSTNSSANGEITNGYTGNTTKTDHSYVPNVSAESLAKQIVNAATPGDTKIGSKYARYTINKYLVNLYDNYNIDYDYFNELIFMLSSHGFIASSYPEMRVQMITYETSLKYDNIYKNSYERFVVSGYSEGGARLAAKRDAVYQSMRYIYSQSDSLMEFEKCCYAMGFTTDDIETFIRRNDIGDSTVSGGYYGGTTSRAE